MGKIKKSSVWQYFLKDDFSRGGICKICQRQVSCSGNTTNLTNHLKRYHKAIGEKTANNNGTQQTTDDQIIEDMPTEASCVRT